MRYVVHMEIPGDWYIPLPVFRGSGLIYRPRATNGGVNTTYLPLNKSLPIGIVVLADQ